MGAPFVRRELYDALEGNLRGAPRLIQVVTGPRQVGKTTLAVQVHDRWPGTRSYATSDDLRTPDRDWLRARWEEARAQAGHRGRDGLLVLDEVQKIPGWSETVKSLWDGDRRSRVRLRVVLLGSSALLVGRGLTESLAGRFELHRHPHWSYPECRAAFGVSLEEWWRFGGYPAGLLMRRDPPRWSRYIRDAIIETVIGRDILLTSPVQKPALLRQVFGMACGHPAEIVSLQKMLGQLVDAGNATTVAHHLHLLSAAYLLAVLPRWSGSRLLIRGSIPKLIVRDNALADAMVPPDLERARLFGPMRGRLIENAVGAALVVLSERTGAELFYWRDRQDEVDFVLRHGSRLVAIEVKSGRPRASGLAVFRRRWPTAKSVLVGGTGADDCLPLDRFFEDPSSVLKSER
ncbi:MAG: ATP-binding protein [Candidatus Coatesbacteria bacterium]